jgi:hypothetical protein
VSTLKTKIVGSRKNCRHSSFVAANLAGIDPSTYWGETKTEKLKPYLDGPYRFGT